MAVWPAVAGYFASHVGNQAVGRFSSPVARAACMAGNLTMPNNLVSPEQLVSLYNDGLLSFELYKTFMRLHGCIVTTAERDIRKYRFVGPVLDYDIAAEIQQYNVWDALSFNTEWIPDINTSLLLWLQGRVSHKTARTWLYRAGIRDENMQDSLVSSRMQIPPVQDLIRFAIREVFNKDLRKDLKLDAEIENNPDFLFWAKKNGLGPMSVAGDNGETVFRDWARDYWAAHWVQPSAQQAYEFLHRLRPDRVAYYQQFTPGVQQFTMDDLRQLLKVNDFSPRWRDSLAAISYRPPRLVDLRRMIGFNLINRAQAKGHLQDYGYDPILSDQLVDFLMVSSHRKPSVGQIVKWRNAGLIDDFAARSKMKELTVEDKDISLHLNYGTYFPPMNRAFRWFRAGYITEQSFTDIMDHYGANDDDKFNFIREAKSKPARLTTQLAIGKVKEAYQVGYISAQDVRQHLEQLQVEPDDIDASIKTIDLEVNIAFLKQAIAGVRRRFLGGELDRMNAGAQLTHLGVNGDRVQTYLNTWEVQLVTHHRTLSAQKVVDMMKRGLIDATESNRRLLNLGYPQTDAALLVIAGGQDVQKATVRAALQAARTAAAEERARKAAIRQAESAYRTARSELARHGSPTELTDWYARELIDGAAFMRRLKALDWPLADAQIALEKAEEKRCEREKKQKGACTPPNISSTTGPT